MDRPFPLENVGIVGGGQLARMMIYRGKKLGFRFNVLDPDPDCGAAALADTFLLGGLYDREKLRQLVQSSSVTTYDIEHTDTAVLKELEAEGHRIFPSPRLLETVQDKVRQKELYLHAGLPVAPFFVPGSAGLTDKDFPVVQKARRGGYDGRGVAVLRLLGDERLPGETFFEQFVPFEKELGVMAARSQDGSLVVYPVTEMVFDPVANICVEVRAPAVLPSDLEKKAGELAVAAVEALDGVGVFGVELFLTSTGSLLVNETAPRPHNSGHYTMEACQVCQFENHLRAISGLPLGEPGFHSSAVMRNLLGDGKGPVRLRGLDEALRVPGFSLHLYGKSECRPGRKMGHFTVLGSTVQSALESAVQVNKTLRVTGSE